MQALFQADANNDYSPEGVRLFRENFEVSKNVIPFFSRLTAGVIEYKDEIDQCIHRVSTNWKISRMSRVDRNAMRIAVFEILYCDDIPFKVSIDEAVDLGKKYGTKDSGAFINGILDSIHASATSLP